ncbi:BZ3500_MvSof-1268-A1-R1_Chr3-2g06300 [Microbotryum saponariae]|uniref:BZ3500_MvSof-1268-A1-R1_Chr3-2g06300 protein n=1 Tax=Microbotryum saponariae TaxID=289078 RepID=A0A2X0MVA0_9BASI|nr:BZ3500_MvSof-1268-A1-R1_Chr3-2g06300 [Microbotryum saponariae]SDA04271.1 BZ3501_MvSof-1269-A2-R1_Chr3-2g05991 [Microbotryum saponariae]
MTSSPRLCPVTPSSNSERPSQRSTPKRTREARTSADGCAECAATSVDPPVLALEDDITASDQKPVQMTRPAPSPSPSQSSSWWSSLSSSSSRSSTPTMSDLDTVVAALEDATDDMEEYALLKGDIVPRLWLRSMPELVEQVFGIDHPAFDEISQRARQSGGQVQSGQAQDIQAELRKRFQEAHDGSQNPRIEPSTSQLAWMQGVARLAQTDPTHGKQFKLAVAVAERPARLYIHDTIKRCFDSSPGSDKEPTEWTPFLACCKVESSSKTLLWNRVLVPCAFGARPRSPFPGDGPGASAPELVRVVLDLTEHVLSQPTRLFAPGLAVSDRKAYLVVLDQETCRVATISDCWGQGFGELAAVLSILLDLDVYSAGFCPFFDYTCHSTSGIAPASLLTSVFGSSVGRTVKFEDKEPIELLSCAKGDGGHHLSGRCTTVFQLTRPSLSATATAPEVSTLSPSFVLKMQLVGPDFVRVESNVLRKINAARDKGALPPAVFDHLATLETSASLALDSGLPVNDEDQSSAAPMPAAKKRRRDDTSRSPHTPIRRTLELLVLRNPSPLPQPLFRRHLGQQQLPLTQIFRVFDQLLTVLATLHDLGFHHRDLSLGNILHFEGHLVLIDWDGGIAADPGVSFAIAAREEGRLRVTYRLAHAFESAVYCLFHALVYRIKPEDPAWDYFFRCPAARPGARPRYAEDREAQLIDRRASLWGEGGGNDVKPQYRERLINMLRREDCELGESLDLVTRLCPVKVTSLYTSDECSQAMDAIQEGIRRLAAKRSMGKEMSQ